MTDDMTETMETMPGPVKTARIVLWGKAGLGLFAAVILMVFAGQISRDIGAASGVIMMLGLVTLAFAVVFGLLAYSCTSRRGWVRITAIAVEGLLIIGGLVALIQGAGSSQQFVGFALSFVVVVSMLRQEAVAWFDR